MVYLKEYRKRARLTRQQVAERLGVHPPAVYKWENNITSPSLRDAQRLAEAYGILPEQLFVDPENEASPPRTIDALEVLARVAGVSPAAWLHVAQDYDRLSEAEATTRLLSLWDALSEDFKAHWLAIAELQVSAQGALDDVG